MATLILYIRSLVYSSVDFRLWTHHLDIIAETADRMTGKLSHKDAILKDSIDNLSAALQKCTKFEI